MRAIERAKGLRSVQVIITQAQHKRLRIRAAMDSTTVSELIRARLIDIMYPVGAEDGRAMAEHR